jgi:hypothetical protein
MLPRSTAMTRKSTPSRSIAVIPRLWVLVLVLLAACMPSGGGPAAGQSTTGAGSRVIDEEDESLCDALQTIFPMDTEDAYMVWNWIHVPLGYKYTFSFMVEDVLMILEQLMKHESGELTNCWPVQELRADWHMKWQGDTVEIRAQWETAPGFTEELLRARPMLIMNKGAFISEWKQVLGVILEALTQAGYHETQLRNLAKLREIHAAIREPGILYRSAT